MEYDLNDTTMINEFKLDYRLRLMPLVLKSRKLTMFDEHS